MLQRRRALLSAVLGAFATLPVASLNFLPAPTNAYLHIPFCRRRCFYCDFPVKVVGDAGPGAAALDYVALLKREIAATAESYWSGDFPDSSVIPSTATTLGGAVATAGGLQTLYFGGGTPSLLDPPLLGSLVEAMAGAFGGLAPGCEVTLEMDPGTFDGARLGAYLDCGVTRVSLGVQVQRPLPPLPPCCLGAVDLAQASWQLLPGPFLAKARGEMAH